MKKARSSNKDIANEGKNKMRNILIILLIILVSIFAAIYVLPIIISSAHYKLVGGANIIEYQQYLNEKYGPQEGFYYVREGNCNWFSGGFCKLIFSSSASNGREFEVKAVRHYSNGGGEANGYEFTDNYK